MRTKLILLSPELKILAGERKRCSLLASKDLWSQFQCRQAVDGILFQLVNSTGVLLGMLQSAMTEETGDSLDVGTVIEDVHGEAMAGAMPADVFFDTGTFYPSLH